MIKIGSIEINRGATENGFVFKDEEAFFDDYDAPCYVPELSNHVYTHNEILGICGDREDIATECFFGVDWQHPESWYEELFTCGGFIRCEACGYVYDGDEDDECPACGHMKEEE